MAHKFILLVNNKNKSGDEYDSYDDAYNEYLEWLEGIPAGRDLHSLMGDIDESDVFEDKDFEYKIVELDKNGNQVLIFDL